MTYTFNSDTILLIDGFIYCIDKNKGVLISEPSITSDDRFIPAGKTSGKVCEDYAIVATNNPALKGVPQLPELTEDVNSLAKDYAHKMGWYNAGANDLGKNWCERDFIEGYKAASKKQFTLEEMENAFRAGREYLGDGYVFDNVHEYLLHFNYTHMKIPKEISISIEANIPVEFPEKPKWDKVKILSITW